MSRRDWVSFIVGLVIGLSGLALIPSNKGCSKLGALTGNCEASK